MVLQFVSMLLLQVSLRIQSECWKMRTRITPNTDTFHAVHVLQFFHFFYFYFFIFIFIFYYFGCHIVPLIIRFSQTANSSHPILQFQINLTFKSTELPVLTKPPSNQYSQFSCLQHEPKSLSRTLREKCPNTEFFLVRIAERYSASLFIQSECGKIRTRKTPYLETFHAVVLLT